MKTLSLDMSTRKTGWALYEDKKLMSYGLIESSKENMFERLKEMYLEIQELIKKYKVQNIICEDVPVSMHSNLQTGKDLCVLQGCILALAFIYDLHYEFLKPTVWRASLGLHRTLFTCKHCGDSREFVSGKYIKSCVVCGCNNKLEYSNVAINDRNSLKKRAVEFANELFSLNLAYVSKGSKKNEDDIAEAILIGYYFTKGIESNGE